MVWRPIVAMITLAVCVSCAGTPSTRAVRSPVAHASASTWDPVSASAPARPKMHYPEHCDGVPLRVIERRRLGLHAGARYFLLHLACMAEDGTGGNAILIYRGKIAPGWGPLQALIHVSDGWAAAERHVQVSSTGVAFRVRGYSTGALPRCCADIHTTLRWKWKGGWLVEVSPEPGHVRN